MVVLSAIKYADKRTKKPNSAPQLQIIAATNLNSFLEMHLEKRFYLV